MRERAWLQGWLAVAAPLLIVLAVLGLLQRRGADRLQAVPALLIGSGLVASSVVGRRRHRRRVLQALRQSDG